MQPAQSDAVSFWNLKEKLFELLEKNKHLHSILRFTIINFINLADHI